jgi:ribonuclease HII
MIKPTLNKENELWKSGIKFVGGIDEAGRGAWAGPVVAAVVIFAPGHIQIADVRDSKLVTPKKRRELYYQILDEAEDFGIGAINNRVIDQHGIAKATELAYQEAIGMLTRKPEYLLIDAFSISSSCPQEAIVKGDQKIYSISCASILAKVYRDNLMEYLDDRYTNYEFPDHKGYGTKKHQEVLAEYGPCDLHRLSYKPIRKLL